MTVARMNALVGLSRGAAAVLAVLALAGCVGSDHDDLRDWVAQERKTAKPRITPLSEPKVFVPQPYTVASVTAPFDRQKLTLALRRDSQQNASNRALLEAEQNRRKQELESYPLDAITMVGSMQQNGGQTALVRVNQLIYQVKPGGYMGQNYGRIQTITENSIQLREIVQDPAGDWVEKSTVLELQERGK